MTSGESEYWHPFEREASRCKTIGGTFLKNRTVVSSIAMFVLLGSTAVVTPAVAAVSSQETASVVSQRESWDPLASVQQLGNLASIADQAGTTKSLSVQVNPSSLSAGQELAVTPISDVTEGPVVRESNGLPVTVYSASNHGYVIGRNSDGSNAGFVSIKDSSAPSSFKFSVGDVRGAVSLDLQPDGSIRVLGADGTIINTVLKPWAKDASGKNLPTSYAVEGNVITQSVDHRGAQYPVVADPSFGCGVGWCSMYLNRSETNNIANFPATGVGVVTGACAKAPVGVAFICGIAAGHVVDMAVNAQRQNQCVGLVAYGVPPIVSWNAFIHGEEHCR